MRAYSRSEEDDVRTLDVLKGWAAEGLISDEQHQSMKQDVDGTLRRTNGFLRAVLFLFTLLSAAAAGLFFAVFLDRSGTSIGFWLVAFAPICYAGAEVAVAEGLCYRYGLEEALAVLSIIFLYAGMEIAFFGPGQAPRSMASVMAAAGMIASLGIYLRFGFQYSFAGAMIFAAMMPHYWTGSQDGQHLIVAAFYASGLATIVWLRRGRQLGSFENDSPVIEALLWSGLYLSVNLHLSSVELLARWWGVTARPSGFSQEFYWISYFVIWILPAAMLWRAVKVKDRVIGATGMVLAILTLVTNKPYLGWARHAWDPILLGVLLAGGAIGIRRWLESAPAGVRDGFTARRCSRDERWGHIVAGLALVLPGPGGQAHGDESVFRGGSSGGGGASSDF